MKKEKRGTALHRSGVGYSEGFFGLNMCFFWRPSFDEVG